MRDFASSTQLVVGDYVIGLVYSVRFPNGHKACGIVTGVQGFTGGVPLDSRISVRVPISITDFEDGFAPSQNLSKIDTTIGTKSYSFITRH